MGIDYTNAFCVMRFRFPLWIILHCEKSQALYSAQCRTQDLRCHYFVSERKTVADLDARDTDADQADLVSNMYALYGTIGFARDAL